MCGTLTAAPKPQTGFVRHDTLALVESAIKIVRQRRSLKAIETYEQVKCASFIFQAHRHALHMLSVLSQIPC